MVQGIEFAHGGNPLKNRVSYYNGENAAVESVRLAAVNFQYVSVMVIVSV